MKVLLLFFLFNALQGYGQTAAPVVTMSGIGEIRVGMKRGVLEKLIGRTVPVKNLIRKEWAYDSVQFTFKEIAYLVVLDKSREENSTEYIVREVRSSTLSLKTKSGVAIGDDRLKIVSTYPDYMIHLMPEYENDYTVKSKTRSTALLFADGETVIIFYMTEGRITAFSVAYYYGC